MVKENETTNVGHGYSLNMVVTDPEQKGIKIVKGQSVKSIRKYLEENFPISKGLVQNSEEDWKKYCEDRIKAEKGTAKAAKGKAKAENEGR